MKSVNYSGDGTETLGVGGDGVNGRIGNAGGSATGTQTASGSQTTSVRGHNGASSLRVGGASLLVTLLAGMLMACAA